MKFHVILVINLFILFSSKCMADIYLHNPRGSNNRLNEASATRANNNRLFDSQNNARGGYNVGDSKEKASTNEDDHYNMMYVASGLNADADSILTVEWTNQHGCGANQGKDPNKLNCNVVLQYMCQDNPIANIRTGTTLRNGQNTATQDYNTPVQSLETLAQKEARHAKVALDRGLHEDISWYDACYLRQRNQGLFTADQNLQKNQLGVSSAIYTRQNANGQRRGFECPEERDYYPYWQASPWIDIAVLTSNLTDCSRYKTESFNAKPRSGCLQSYSGSNTRIPWSLHGTEQECVANGGKWMKDAWYSYLHKLSASNKAQCEQNTRDSRWKAIWAIPYDSKDGITSECLIVAPPPECTQAPWIRPNYLGNTLTGEPMRYDWKLPSLGDGITKRCVFRIRYNMTTEDYDPYNTDSTHNGANKTPITGNPNLDVGINNYKNLLQIAVNTAQYGRTFEDRSHVFYLKSRNLILKNNGNDLNSRIYNLNVRGKRGNIVQVYPAVEYDFIPNRLTVKSNVDLVHLQWTGSNTHNNNAPGGDGQTGDDGQGTGGTDRSNIIVLTDPAMNYPAGNEWNGEQERKRFNLWKEANVVWSDSWSSSDTSKLTNQDYAIYAATSGYIYCKAAAACGSRSYETKTDFNPLLNNAPASFAGLIFRLRTNGTYFYACSRNNNFSNRSQKGMIVAV